ncbi:cold-shock protein [Streptomyces monashensis]|uniref:cold-shock protein n=1 Tax=Streptomyces monashensis TaxID=1678012 RepID=UPI003F53F77D
MNWFNDDKGYGFMTPESGPDLWVRFRAIEGNGFKFLKEDQKVTFEAVQGRKGMQADKVQVTGRKRVDRGRPEPGLRRQDGRGQAAGLKPLAGWPAEPPSLPVALVRGTGQGVRRGEGGSRRRGHQRRRAAGRAWGDGSSCP